MFLEIKTIIVTQMFEIYVSLFLHVYGITKSMYPCTLPCLNQKRIQTLSATTIDNQSKVVIKQEKGKMLGM